MRLAAVFALLAGAVSGAGAAPIEPLVTAIETNDTSAVMRFVTDYYSDAGISVNESLVWKTQRFDEIVNWYNDLTETIMLAELPKPEETEAYWDNWSRVLTGSRWDWRRFFADAEEAHRLAGFNQFILAAHEYGHALTYRYDREHERRTEYEINCREYPADRLAAALLEEVAEKDAEIATLRQRYRELIAVINTEISPDARFEAPDLAALDADCRIMHVEQPTDEASMTPYASAFFARHAALLAADLPSLAEVYETHLAPYWREKLIPDAGLAGPVTTVRTFPGISLNPEPHGLEYERRIASVTPDEDVYLIELSSGANHTYRVAYGPIGEPLEEVVPTSPIGFTRSDDGDLFFSTAVSLGPDRFAAINGLFLDDGAYLLIYDKGADGWKETVHRLSELESSSGKLVLMPGGDVLAFVTVYDEALNFRDVGFRYHPDTGELEELGVQERQLTAVLAGGAEIVEGDKRLMVRLPQGDRTYAGNALQGLKDSSDAMAAEFVRLDLGMAPTPDGGLLLLDLAPPAFDLVLRRIAPAQKP